MYTMNSSNNTFAIHKATAVGFGMKTPLVEIKTLIKADLTLDTNITITYNEAQNTYTFTQNSLATEVYTFIPITIGKLLTLTNNVGITITSGGVSTGLINLQDSSKARVLRVSAGNFAD